MIPPFSFTSLPWIGAAAAAVGMFWGHAQAVLSRLRSFFIVKITVDGKMAHAVTGYCWKHLRRSPFGDRYYRSDTIFVRPLERVQAVGYEGRPAQALIFWRGVRPITLSSPKPEGYSSPPQDTAVLSTFKLWFDIEDFLIKALCDYNAQLSAGGGTVQEDGEVVFRDRFAVKHIRGRRRRGSGEESHSGNKTAGTMVVRDSDNFPNGGEKLLQWTHEDIGQPRPKDPMSAIAIPTELQCLVDEFMRWKDSEKWFKEKQVPWRRGWLLYGKPGTGKTSLVRALGQLGGIPVFAYDLSTLSNDDMSTAWRDMLESVPCIALLEDIDAVFEGRVNVLGDFGGGLTFDCLLNCISGVERADGVFTIVTTNRLEMIDPALGVPGSDGISSRPGRLDKAVEILPLPDYCRRQIAKRILGEWPDVVEGYVERGDGMTAAQFTELCVQEALARYWARS